jgi:hypothetical protein
VFAGNTGDPKTVASQVTKVKDRFALTRVVLVGDRGMLTAARLREDVRPEGLDWITALRAPQVKKLVRDGDLQLSLFDVQDLAEITSPDFPGERLVACINPFLEVERARKRESLLAATEDRVRAHVFLRMISYYITWHMQARLAPVLFTDDDKPAAQAARSPKALAKAATKHTPAATRCTASSSLHECLGCRQRCGAGLANVGWDAGWWCGPAGSVCNRLMAAFRGWSTAHDAGANGM